MIVFSFKEVEAILSAAIGIADSKRKTFVARLQQLQKFGVPGKTNVGRAGRATYDAGQILKLHLALDLLDVGATPILIARLFSQMYDSPRIAVECAHIERMRSHKEGDTLIVIVPGALTHLRVRDPAFDEERPLGAFYFTHELEERASGPRIVISLTERVERLIACIGRVRPELIGQLLFQDIQHGS